MPNTPTPGEQAYAAYQMAYDCSIWTLPWAQLQPHFRQVWEAAAQAVLGGSEGFRFAVGQHVTWDEAPGATWQVIERRHHEGAERIWRTYDLLPAAGDLTDFRPLSAYEAHLEAAEDTP